MGDSERRARILLPHTGIYPGLGAMLREELARRGWRATVNHRATRHCLDQELLLLCGQCFNIYDLSRVLAQRGPGHPVTVLWQLEPLPPPELSPAGEALGLKLARLSWAQMPKSARRVLNCVLPFRTRLFKRWHAWLAREYQRQVELLPGQEGWVRFRSENLSATSSEWLWLRHAHRNGWVDHWFASNEPRARFLRSRGISAQAVPVGYHPEWGKHLEQTRDIDVLFLGATGQGPRGRVVAQLCREFARRGRQLTLAAGIYGAAREQILNRARIVLNLLRVPHDLPGMRLLMGLACGAFVLSETCPDSGAFVPGKHFVMANLEEIPDVAEDYLGRERERVQIAEEGHRFITRELTLQNALDRLLPKAAAASL